MSKICTEILKATGLTAQKEGESFDKFSTRLCKAISDLDDKAWGNLSSEAQDWYNSALDAVEADKPVPAFPDAEEEKKDSAPRRRGAAAPAEPEDDGPAEPKVGDAVEATTKRGKCYVGKVVEIDEEVVVVATDDGDEELTRSRLESLKVVGGGKKRRAADDEDESEDEGPAEPKVGDVVKLVTKRDKEYEGKLVELDSEIAVISIDGEETEFTRDRVKSLTLVGGGKKRAVAADDAADKPARRGSEKKADEEAPAKPAAKRATAAANGGVSVSTVVRQLIAEDLAITKEAITKELTKRGLEWRQNTVDLLYADSHKMLAALKEAGKLKG